MNILILSHLYPPSRIGGMEKIAQMIAENLTENNFKVYVVTGNYKYSSNKSEVRYLNNVEIHSISEIVEDFPNPFITEHMYANFDFIKIGLDIIKKKEIDYIYAHDWFVAQAAEIISDITGIPLISTFHYCKVNEMLGRENINGEIISNFQKKLYDNSDIVALYSYKLIKEFEKLGWDKEKIRYFPIPFEDIKLFDKDQHYKKKNRFVFIGRLSKEKNIALILEAARHLSDVRDLQIDIIGDGNLRTLLEEMAITYKLNVNFHGFINDYKRIKEIIQSAKGLILPSTYDCFGLVLLESLQCGTPILASTGVGGIQISKKVKKYTFSPSASLELSEKMRMLLYPTKDVIDDILEIQNDAIAHHDPKNSIKYLIDIFNPTIKE